DPESVESAARVLLHVAKIVRVHELAVRIELGEHAFHCGGDEIVITGFVSIDIILPDQLDGFREDRDLRITAVISRVRGPGFMKTQAEKKAAKQKANQRGENKALLHSYE